MAKIPIYRYCEYRYEKVTLPLLTQTSLLETVAPPSVVFSFFRKRQPHSQLNQGIVACKFDKAGGVF
jgi:hypothetical protein